MTGPYSCEGCRYNERNDPGVLGVCTKGFPPYPPARRRCNDFKAQDEEAETEDVSHET